MTCKTTHHACDCMIKQVADQDALIRKLIAALQGIVTNPHVHLSDLVYHVRESEGCGWEGEYVKAWGEACSAVDAALLSPELKAWREKREGK